MNVRNMARRMPQGELVTSAMEAARSSNEIHAVFAASLLETDGQRRMFLHTPHVRFLRILRPS